MVSARLLTTTTLAAPQSPSVSGQSVTFTATKTTKRWTLPSRTIDQVPTGTVTFYDNGISIGTANLNGGSGEDEANFTTSNLATATYSITAAYTSGDSNFVPSPVSAAVSQVVNPANTGTSLGTSGNPSVHGQVVTFTATVSVESPGSTAVAYPTGSVTFYDNGTPIGTGALSVAGGQDRATLSTNILSTATHPITAAYTSGDGNFNASADSAALNQVVNKDSTTTAATASLEFAFRRQAGPTGRGLLATVTANAPGSGIPTGTVDFFDATTGTDLTPGGVGLVSGSASLSTTGLASGPHAITVSYSGDGNFVASSGSAGTVTIGQSILVLDPTAGGALSISGNASIKLAGPVFVDSGSSSALSASGNAQIKALRLIDVWRGGSRPSQHTREFSTRSAFVEHRPAAVGDPLSGFGQPGNVCLFLRAWRGLSGNLRQ